MTGPTTVSVSPHRRDGETVPLIMWTVVLSLMPAGLVGLYVFGWRAAFVTILSVTTCCATEAVIQKLRGVRITVSDGSAAVTGVLLAFVLPASVSWYVPVVGGIVAIGAGKHVFGGLGANFFNPALLARAFLQFAFATQVTMAKWPIIAGAAGFGRIFSDCSVGSADAITRATPLELLSKNPGVEWQRIAEGTPFGPPFVWLLPAALAWIVFALLIVGAIAGISLLMKNENRFGATFGIGALLLVGVMPMGDITSGLIPGCIGETSAWALLLGGIALVYYRIINWRLPFAYILTVAVLVALLPVRGPDGSLTGIFFGQFQAGRLMVHLFGGGLFLGAFFMITDMVTSPLTSKGQVAFGILAGCMVALIRVYGGYPEGVCYSILIANAARPLIDRLTMPRVFGLRQPTVGAAKAAQKAAP